MLIVMHYFAGAPFKRFEALHQAWGVPIPDANQWCLANECDDLLAPLYRALERHGIRNAISLRFDDTGSMVIELRRQIQMELQLLALAGGIVSERPLGGQRHQLLHRHGQGVGGFRQLLDPG